jgi:hypothetical protein
MVFLEGTAPPESSSTTAVASSAPEVPYSVTEQDVEVMTFGVLGLLAIIACCLVAVVVRGG